jgi:hypothetical protein
MIRGPHTFKLFASESYRKMNMEEQELSFIGLLMGYCAMSAPVLEFYRNKRFFDLSLVKVS